MSNDADTAQGTQASGIGLGTILRLLLIVAGTLAAVAFLGERLGFGLSPVMTALTQRFEDLLATPLFAVEPVVKWVGAYAGVDLQLYPHFRHVFVLLWLLFISIARAVYRYGDIGGAVFTAVWGGVVALATAAVCGTVAVDNPVLTVFFGIGTTFFFLTRPGGEHFGRALPGAVAIADWCGLALAILQLTSVPPIVAVTAYIGLLGLTFMIVGIAKGVAAPEKSGASEKIMERVFGSGLTVVGLDILSVLGAAVFIVALSRFTA